MSISADKKAQATIKYPVDFDLKVIMGVTYSVDEQRQQIEKVLLDLEVPYSHWQYKLSSKANFISHSVRVHLDCQERMHSMYAKLKRLPDIKMAL